MEDIEKKMIEISDALSADNFEYALFLLQPLIESDIPQALGMLGLMNQVGRGVERNGAEAVRLLTRAIELGDGTAAHNLGTLYAQGQPGVEKNLELSRRFYQKAKEMGAQYAEDSFYEDIDREQGAVGNEGHRGAEPPGKH